MLSIEQNHLLSFPWIMTDCLIWKVFEDCQSFYIEKYFFELVMLPAQIRKIKVSNVDFWIILVCYIKRW